MNSAQAAYDLVKGNPDIAARPEALALQQATASLDAARGAYTVIAQGATRQQLAVAEVAGGGGKGSGGRGCAAIPSAEARVQSAQAVVDRAQAALEGLIAGATTEERAMAEARVASARAALATAQAQLAQTQVFAPFGGQVGAVCARPGEMATPGQALLILGDTSQMRVETTDLRETDVGRAEDRHAGGGHLRRAARAGLPGHDPHDRSDEQRREGQHQLHGDRRRAGVGSQSALGDDGVCEHPDDGRLTIDDGDGGDWANGDHRSTNSLRAQCGRAAESRSESAIGE